MALNTTRSILWSLIARFSFRTSSTCQEIASPSRSGSVARISRSAPFSALAMSLSRPDALGSTSQIIWKLASGSTDPVLAERGQNLIGRAQILIDRLGLRRRLDNDDIHVIPMAYGRNEGRFREIR